MMIPKGDYLGFQPQRTGCLSPFSVRISPFSVTECPLFQSSAGTDDLQRELSDARCVVDQLIQEAAKEMTTKVMTCPLFQSSPKR